jgi:hypothetical protein
MLNGETHQEPERNWMPTKEELKKADWKVLVHIKDTTLGAQLRAAVVSELNKRVVTANGLNKGSAYPLPLFS